MTTSLPQRRPRRLRALHHHRVHDDRRPPAADHLAGHARTTRPGARDDRRHHRARLPEEGRRRAAQPAGRAAVLRPDRLRDRRAAIQVLVQGTAEVDDATSTRTASATGASRGEKLPATKTMHAARSSCAGAVRLVLRADLRQGPSRAGASSGPTATWPSRRRSTTRTSRRSARATARSRPSRTRPPPAARRAGTSAWTSSARATPTAVLSWVGPDGFPLAVRLPVAVDSAAAAGADRGRARRAPAREPAAPA